MFEFYRQINGLYACWSAAEQEWLISDMSRELLGSVFSVKEEEIEDINPDLPSLPAAMKRSALPSLHEYMLDRGADGVRSVYRFLTVSRFPVRSFVYEYTPEIKDVARFSWGRNPQRWKSALSFSLWRKDAKRALEEGEDGGTQILCSSERMFQYLHASTQIQEDDNEIWIHFNKFLLTLPEEDLFGLILLELDGKKRSEIVYSII
jgi:hypothetical protein